jgi:hypothetical protein
MCAASNIASDFHSFQFLSTPVKFRRARDGILVGFRLGLGAAYNVLRLDGWECEASRVLVRSARGAALRCLPLRCVATLVARRPLVRVRGVFWHRQAGRQRRRGTRAPVPSPSVQ